MPLMSGDGAASLLDRETAYFAMEELQHLVAVFGALNGEFELWVYEHPRARGSMHIFQWPPDVRSEATST